MRRAATDVAAIVANDLKLSGRFAPLDRADMVTRPTNGAAIRFQDWRLLKSDFIVVGRVEPDAAGQSVTFELFNVQTGQPLLTQSIPTNERGPARERAPHRRRRLRAADRHSGRVLDARRLRRGRGQGAGPALQADRRRCGRIRAAQRDGLVRADHVAGLVAGRAEPGVRVVRGQGVSHLRAAACDGRAQARLGALRHQRRAGLVSRRHSASRSRSLAMAISTSTRSNSPRRRSAA